jgi:hypothetical protein
MSTGLPPVSPSSRVGRLKIKAKSLLAFELSFSPNDIQVSVDKAFANISFLVHDINVVHQNQCIHIRELPQSTFVSLIMFHYETYKPVSMFI